MARPRRRVSKATLLRSWVRSSWWRRGWSRTRMGLRGRTGGSLSLLSLCLYTRCRRYAPFIAAVPAKANAVRVTGYLPDQVSVRGACLRVGCRSAELLHLCDGWLPDSVPSCDHARCVLDRRSVTCLLIRMQPPYTSSSRSRNLPPRPRPRLLRKERSLHRPPLRSRLRCGSTMGY